MIQIEVTVVQQGRSGISSGDIGGIVGGALGAVVVLLSVAIYLLLRKKAGAIEGQNKEELTDIGGRLQAES
jgi:hypothetical protein